MFYPTFYPNSCYGSNQHQLRYPVPPCNNSQVVSQVVPTTSYIDGPWFNPVHYTNTIVEPVPYFTTEVPPLTQQVFQRPPIKIRMKPQPSSCTMATLYSHKIFVGSLAKDVSFYIYRNFREQKFREKGKSRSFAEFNFRVIQNLKEILKKKLSRIFRNLNF